MEQSRASHAPVQMLCPDGANPTTAVDALLTHTRRAQTKNNEAANKRARKNEKGALLTRDADQRRQFASPR